MHTSGEWRAAWFDVKAAATKPNFGARATGLLWFWKPDIFPFVCHKKDRQKQNYLSGGVRESLFLLSDRPSRRSTIYLCLDMTQWKLTLAAACKAHAGRGLICPLPYPPSKD